MSEPLKKLLFKNLNAKRWMELGLGKMDLESVGVSVADKQKFGRMMVAARGQRVKDIVKEFWTSCKGQAFKTYQPVRDAV